VIDKLISIAFLTLMCGRYVLAQSYEALKNRYNLVNSGALPFKQTPRYNIAPSQMSAVVTSDNGSGNKLQSMKWGLIPHWAKDASIGFKLINARSETVREKPSFRDAFKKKRCLVPVTGFYEWQKQEEGKIKQPFYITASTNGNDNGESEIFSFAGLWSVWKDPNGEEILSYNILTTEPNGLMEPIHKRMPVILRKDDESKWLDTSSELESLVKLFEPFESERMQAHPVSTLVNSPKNDVAGCIERL